MHRRGRSTKKADCHVGTISHPVTTGGPVCRFSTGDHDTDGPAIFSNSYRAIDEIDLNENAETMMGIDYPA